MALFITLQGFKFSSWQGFSVESISCPLLHSLCQQLEQADTQTLFVNSKDFKYFPTCQIIIFKMKYAPGISV